MIAHVGKCVGIIKKEHVLLIICKQQQKRIQKYATWSCFGCEIKDYIIIMKYNER